jgi:hypothetical protein
MVTIPILNTPMSRFFSPYLITMFKLGINQETAYLRVLTSQLNFLFQNHATNSIP